MATDPRKCPKCGKTMVENFDYKQGQNGITLAIPNGKFDCLWCAKVKK